MGYDVTAHNELLSVQCLQIDDVIHIIVQCSVVLVDVVLKDSFGGTAF